MARDDGRLLAALNDAGVSYIVIGGAAVNIAGYARYTKDIDVIVGATPSEFARVRDALQRLAAKRLDGSALEQSLFDGEHVITARCEFGRIDVLPEGESPLTLSEMLERGTRVRIGEAEAIVSSLEDLIALKELADRPSGSRRRGGPSRASSVRIEMPYPTQCVMRHPRCSTQRRQTLLRVGRAKPAP